jgi:hypothetical protein
MVDVNHGTSGKVQENTEKSKAKQRIFTDKQEAYRTRNSNDNLQIGQTS